MQIRRDAESSRLSWENRNRTLCVSLLIYALVGEVIVSIWLSSFGMHPALFSDPPPSAGRPLRSHGSRETRRIGTVNATLSPASSSSALCLAILQFLLSSSSSAYFFIFFLVFFSRERNSLDRNGRATSRVILFYFSSINRNFHSARHTGRRPSNYERAFRFHSSIFF